MSGRLLPALAVMVIPFAVEAQEADGSLAFNNHCRTCHSTDEGDNRLGPSLHQIIGREAGSVEGYDYSSALSATDLVWDEETLAAFIEDPDSVVPGNEMRPYGCVDEGAIREAIVQHLAGE